MKRVVSSSIVTFLILIAVAAVFFYFRNYRSEQGDPLMAIPSDAVMYLSADPIDEALDAMLAPEVWNSWTAAPAFATLRKRLTDLKKSLKDGHGIGQELTSGSLLLSVHVTGAGTFDFLFLKSVGNSSADELSSLLKETS